MFFDSVHSIHIGKQHWETEGKNAYALNSEAQFNQVGEKPAIGGGLATTLTGEHTPADGGGSLIANTESTEQKQTANEVIDPLNKPIPSDLRSEGIHPYVRRDLPQEWTPIPYPTLEGTMVDHLKTFQGLLDEGRPFALIRPSDGEYSVIKNQTLTNCDKWTFKEGGQLSRDLLEAVQTDVSGLYIGIPCNTCNKPWNCTQKIYDDYRALVKTENITYANIFMNANWPAFVQLLKEDKRPLYVVTSGRTGTTELQIRGRHLIDPFLVNKWDTEGLKETAKILDFVKSKKNALICFSAGPLSKVWIPKCWALNPSNTYLDVGAALDPFTKGPEVKSRFYTDREHPFAKEACQFQESFSIVGKTYTWGDRGITFIHNNNIATMWGTGTYTWLGTHTLKASFASRTHTLTFDNTYEKATSIRKDDGQISTHSLNKSPFFFEDMPPCIIPPSISPPIKTGRQLLYFCIFCQEEYVTMFKMLLFSIRACTFLTNVDILVMTDTTLEKSVLDAANLLGIPIKTMLIDGITTARIAASTKLHIFDYESVFNYERVLYIDTDILVQHDLTPILTMPIEDKLYVKQEGEKGITYLHGSWFFDDKAALNNIKPFNTGVFLFRPTETMRTLFLKIRHHIHQSSATNMPYPMCYEQPYMNYHFIDANCVDMLQMEPHIYLVAQNISNHGDTSKYTMLHYITVPKLKRMYTQLSNICFQSLPNCTNDASIIHKTYSWSSGQIRFEPNNHISTTWGPGTYQQVDSSSVLASWKGYTHRLYFNEDRSEALSIRKGDCIMNSHQRCMFDGAGCPANESGNSLITCEFKQRKPLIYMCTFHDKKYVEMLRLLLFSIKRIMDLKTFDILILTDNILEPVIQDISTLLDMDIKTHVIEGITTAAAASAAKLTIFEYPHIDKYDRVLYLDTDIIVQHDISSLLTMPLEDRLYAKEEGTIGEVYHGEWFFDFNTIVRNIPGFNAGQFLFRNTPTMKRVFRDTYNFMNNAIEQNHRIPVCYEQPYLNYFTIREGLQNTSLMNDYLELDSPRFPSIKPRKEIHMIHYICDVYNGGKDKYVRMMNEVSNIIFSQPASITMKLNPILNKEYTWGNASITFLKDGILKTPWKNGIYSWIDTHTVAASWATHNFRLYFNKQRTSFLSVRKDDCMMVRHEVVPSKNLIYMSVFYNKDYIRLLQLLLISIKLYSSIQNMDILILTSPEFEPLIQDLSKEVQIPLLIKTFNFTTIFEAATARLHIFAYKNIHNYNKILYLDTDILIQKSLDPFFRIELDDKLYALEQGNINQPNFGSQFFETSSSASGFNSGTLLFHNSDTISKLFEETRAHIEYHIKSGSPTPYAMDQPFINYNTIKRKLHDNTTLGSYIALFEDSDTPEHMDTAIVCHFSFPIGNFNHKYARMKRYLNILLQAPICTDNNHVLLGTSYSWSEGTIAFLDNMIVQTTWGPGKYTILDTNRVCVYWSNFYHVLQFDTSGNYFGVRTRPDDFTICTGRRCINDTPRCINDTPSIHFDETIVTPLCRIMGAHGSDKGSVNITTSWHNYTTLYYALLKDRRESIRRVFELGLGTTDLTIPNNMGVNGKPGASLRGWAEFFPHAEVFGADIDKRILFTEDRIKTYYCDQLDPSAICSMWQLEDLQESFDLIIEDGLHTYEANVCFFENSIHMLKAGGLYIIEDIHNRDTYKLNKKIQEWKIQHRDLMFELITIPNSWNCLHNTVLVITKIHIFDDRESMVKELVPNNGICAEIGVFQGTFTKYLHETLKPSKLYMLDLFEGIGYSGDQDGNDVITCNLADTYSHFQNYAKGTVFPLKGDSSTQLATFEDNYFDMIYVDGDHTYEGCKKDLEVAYYKIKKGGFLMGHDYEMNMKKAKNAYAFGVRRAVDEFCQTYQQQICAKGMDGCVSFAIRIQKS
jgi:lipopolysaccharide biosynthesis glycosyltransferase/predicted O-methyltransferase YrrM